MTSNDLDDKSISLARRIGAMASMFRRLHRERATVREDWLGEKCAAALDEAQHRLDEQAAELDRMRLTLRDELATEARLHAETQAELEAAEAQVSRLSQQLAERTVERDKWLLAFNQSEQFQSGPTRRAVKAEAKVQQLEADLRDRDRRLEGADSENASLHAENATLPERERKAFEAMSRILWGSPGGISFDGPGFLPEDLQRAWAAYQRQQQEKAEGAKG